MPAVSLSRRTGGAAKGAAKGAVQTPPPAKQSGQRHGLICKQENGKPKLKMIERKFHNRITYLHSYWKDEFIVAKTINT